MGAGEARSACHARDNDQSSPSPTAWDCSAIVPWDPDVSSVSTTPGIGDLRALEREPFLVRERGWRIQDLEVSTEAGLGRVNLLGQHCRSGISGRKGYEFFRPATGQPFPKFGNGSFQALPGTADDEDMIGAKAGSVEADDGSVGVSMQVLILRLAQIITTNPNCQENY